MNYPHKKPNKLNDKLKKLNFKPRKLNAKLKKPGGVPKS